MVAGILLGLPHGAVGVAFAYSAVMVLWVLPVIAWAVHGTAIPFKDVLLTVTRPLLSGLLAAALTVGVQFACGQRLTSLSRLILESATLWCSYGIILLYVMGQKSFYLDLLRNMSRRSVTQVSA